MNNFSFKRVFTTVKNNFKINKSIPVLIFILVAIVLFLSTTMPIANAESYYLPKEVNVLRYNDYVRSIKYCWEAVVGINGIQAICAVVAAIGSSFLCAVALTSFSRDRRGTDFWCSQALTRSEHLAANLISGFSYFAVSLIPSWFLSLFLAHMFTTIPPMSLGKIILLQIPPLLFVLLFYACILTLAFFACTVAGSVMSALVFFGTILGYPALLAAFCGFVSDNVFHTHLMDILNHNYSFFAYSSPVLRYFFSVNEIYRLTATDYILYALTTIGVGALLFFLVKRKKSELSQNAVTFPILRYPMQYMWSFFFTLFAAWFLYMIIRSPLWFVIGALIGLIVSFMLLNMIFERSFSGLFKKSSHLIKTAVVFVAVTVVFVADVFGMYKEPKPDFDEIESFSIYYNTTKEVTNGEEYSWIDIYSDGEISAEITERDVEVIKLLYEYALEKGNSYIEDGEVWCSLNINIRCENDPSGWYTHAGFYDHDEKIADALNYLASKFDTRSNSEVYEKTVEENSEIIGGADEATGIIVE